LPGRTIDQFIEGAFLQALAQQKKPSGEMIGFEPFLGPWCRSRNRMGSEFNDLPLKRLKRVALIERHVPEVMKYVRFDQPPKLEPLLDFKNPVPMKFARQRMEERIPLRLFSDLVNLWS